MMQVRLMPARAIVVSLVALICLIVVAVATRDAGAQNGPPASGTESRGKVVYEKHCVECHGTSGKGDGPAAMSLTPHPRDFTTGRYKIRSTESGSVPTDDDLLRSVRQGLYGSSMPGWEKILPDEDIRAVVTYIKAFSPRFATDRPELIPAATPVQPSPESATRGSAVYVKLQCGKCHGSDGRGTGAAATSFEDDWGYPLNASNLSEPWTFHGGPTPSDVYMRFRAGVSGTPMPSYKDAATDAEMWDLANYVATLRRKPVWEMSAEEVVAFYKEQDAQALANPVKRGEYLVNSLACPVCHSPVDGDKRMLPGMRLAGGLRMNLAPWGNWTTGNLTSDKETGLGNWTDDEIKRVITKGTLRDGSRMLPFPMDWPSFSTMKESDINAIVAYLRTVPPVRNKVPRPVRTVIPAYLWAKFRMLILGEDIPSYIYAGNAGISGGAGR
jgi:mono/diheme cytochrome c family protein